MPIMNQKLRILYLMDIMLQRTDDQHLLNASQLWILVLVLLIRGH